MKQESNGDASYNWCDQNSSQGLGKGLEELEIGGWTETIQTKALLRSLRIMKRVLEIWGELLSVSLQWKAIS